IPRSSAGSTPWPRRAGRYTGSIDRRARISMHIIPILSFVESSMTRLESSPTIRPWLTSGIDSLLSPSTQPPEFTAGLSSPIRHLSSVICHLPFVICHLSFPVPRSAFRIPHFLERGERKGPPTFWHPGNVGGPFRRSFLFPCSVLHLVGPDPE